MGYQPLKDETKEIYLKIWTHFVVGHFNQRQLAQLFQCSEDTIANAIHWCADNRIQFNINILAIAAQEAVESRLRELNGDIARAKETNPINWNAVIGLYKLIQETEQMLWKFQTIIEDKHIIQVNVPDTPYISLMKCLTREMEEMDMTDDERKVFISLLDKQRKVSGKHESAEKPSQGNQ